MSKSACKTIEPVNLRKFFWCKKGNLALEKNEVRINLEMRSPNTIETKAMEAITIPVLLGKDVKGQKTKMLLIEDNLIFETSTGYQSFETWEKIGGG